MSSSGPHWPPGQPGAEALFKGPKGDPGPPGKPGTGITRGARHAFIYLIGVAIIFGIAALIIGVRQVDAFNIQQAILRAQQVKLEAALNRVAVLAQSQCASNEHLGTVPIPVKVPGGQAAPSRFGIRFVVDARNAWHRARCPGHLAPVSKGLVFWAHRYKLPLG